MHDLEWACDEQYDAAEPESVGDCTEELVLGLDTTC